MTDRGHSSVSVLVGPGVLAIVLAIVLGALAGTAGCSCQSEPARAKAAVKATSVASFYALDVLPTFHLTLDDQAITQLKDDPREFVGGTLVYEGDRYENVGIRLKGHRSMRPLEAKPSFKIRFDKYVEGQSFLGQRYLVLNNMVEDPTMLREILGYRLYRAMGVPAPEVGYALVFVNGAAYGLYAMVESLDERFLARSFRDGTGGLYEGEYGCDLYEDDIDGFDQDSGKDDSRADLRAFAAAAAGPAERLFAADQGVLELRAFLAYLAVSAFLGDFDGYRHSHNYRIYHEPSAGKWYFLPWGIDRTFKKDLSIFDSEGLLAKRCFAHAPCRLAYVQTMAEVVTRFEALRLEQGATVVGAFIDQAMRADPRKPHDAAKIAAARAELLAFIAERPAEVRGQLGCIDASGAELDRDGDGHGCMDCSDADPAIHPGAAETCDGVDNDCSGLVDDAAACPCESVSVDGAVFHLCELPMPWTDAAAFCASQGLALARIDSVEQSTALYEEARKRSKDRWWIGLSDRAQEGQFRWPDGTPVTVTRWAKGEPDNDGCNQDCAALKENAKGKWHDTHCGQHRPFICR